MARNPFHVVFCTLFVLGISTALKPRPPSVSLTSLDYFSDHIVAECIVTGFPHPSITWLKDDNVLGISKRISVKQGRINITSATERDEGTYFCEANNTYGVSRSLGKYLTKSTLLTFPTEKPKKVKGQAGSHQHLICRGRPNSQPRPALKDFSWYNGTDKISHSRRVSVDQSGDLHFLPLIVEDESKNNVTYNCSVYNAESRLRVYGSSTELTVMSGGDPQPRPPNLVYHTQNTTVNVGDWLELQCIADGYPQPEVKWTPPGGSHNSRYKEDKSLYSLSVRKVSKKDEGIYICSANNSMGEVEHTIQVTVIEKLSSHIDPSMVVLPEGKSQKFRCVMNEVGADIKWFINNKPANVFTENERIRASGDSLAVQNVQKPRDTFSIQCHVTKDTRAHVSDATLTVIEPIEIKASPDSPVEIARGKTVHLSVNATVDPDYQDDLKYIWHHANSELETSSLDTGIRVYRQDRFSHVTIDTRNLTANEFDYVLGEYVCEVTVGVPEATERLHFIVSSKDAGSAEPSEAAVAGTSLWWIGIVCAVIVAVVVVLAIIYIQYQNRGAVYPVDKRERQAGHDPVKELAEETKMQEINRTDESDEDDDC